MYYSEGRCVGSRQPVLPPVSTRTLYHPSFLPLYRTADFPHHLTDYNNQTIHPIIPAEFYYTDPTMSCGSRIPNIVSELRVFDCFQLNTPPPVMSSCPAPPTRPDPFRSGPQHLTRDLGSLAMKINTLFLPVHLSQVVVQLTQEEDQAVTNLLKLHHQEPVESDHELMEEEYEPFCSDVQDLTEANRGRCWSDTELEAADTLLSCFSLMEEDEIWGQDHNKSAETPPDPEPYERQEDSSTSTETQQESETTPGDFSRTLSVSEGDALHVLLSLGDTGALDIVQ